MSNARSNADRVALLTIADQFLGSIAKPRSIGAPRAFAKRGDAWIFEQHLGAEQVPNLLIRERRRRSRFSGVVHSMNQA
jgi:hypothetical protein